MTQKLDFIVNREDLTNTEILTTTSTPLAEGACELRIDLLALTANNVTYAVAREELGYWTFFPTEKPGWGRVPSWGFATVTESRAPGVEVGRRIYGYLPYSSHHRLSVTQLDATGFMEGAPHRADKAGMYNRYSFTDQDAGYRQEDEALISIFRPLFTTSFLIDDHIRLRTDLGIEQIIVSSASSKTAMALAHLVHNNPDGKKLIGLTSASNKAFVEGLKLYDDVVTYDEIANLPSLPSAYVDFSGNEKLRYGLHQKFNDQLKLSLRVGGTHVGERGFGTDGLAGPAPEFFFAPAHLAKRQDDLGAEHLNMRINAATQAFFNTIRNAIDIKTADGAQALTEAWLNAVNGGLSPKLGQIAKLS